MPVVTVLRVPGLQTRCDVAGRSPHRRLDGDPMAKQCEVCGRPTATARHRYCSDVECRRVRARQRKREQRGTVVELRPADAPTEDVSVRAATLATLTDAGRDGTPLGRAALVLADRLDRATGDTGSSTAALARELRATLEDALRGAPQAADRVDEIRAKVVRLRA